MSDTITRLTPRQAKEIRFHRDHILREKGWVMWFYSINGVLFLSTNFETKEAARAHALQTWERLYGE